MQIVVKKSLTLTTNEVREVEKVFIKAGVQKNIQKDITKAAWDQVRVEFYLTNLLIGDIFFLLVQEDLLKRLQIKVPLKGQEAAITLLAITTRTSTKPFPPTPNQTPLTHLPTQTLPLTHLALDLIHQLVVLPQPQTPLTKTEHTF